MLMRRFPAIHILLFAACLLLAGACDRVPQPGEGREIPVLLNLDTKVSGNYEGTFRVALFDNNDEFTGATGTYCSLPAGQSWWSHPWLPPCRVDAATGQALDAALPVGNAVTDLGEADHDSKYGLRWRTQTNNASSVNVSLVAVAPALQVHPDGALGTFAYVTWTPDAEFYVSDPKRGTFTGTWVDAEYVYTSDTKLSTSMVDHRASVTVRIECGELTEGDIQSVTLTNHIKSARYYLMSKDIYERGFSYADGHFTTGPTVLYDCGAGAPDHLVRADGDFRTYEKVYFPAARFSDNALEPIRPEFIIMLGGDKTKPFKVRVVLNQDLNAMTHYTLTLLISRAIVDATLTPTATWDVGGTLTALEDDGLNAGTFPLESFWHDGGSHDAEDVD